MTVNFGIAGIAKQTHKEPMTLGKKGINGLFSPVFAAFCENIKSVIGLSVCKQTKTGWSLGAELAPW